MGSYGFEVTLPIPKDHTQEAQPRRFRTKGEKMRVQKEATINHEQLSQMLCVGMKTMADESK